MRPSTDFSPSASAPPCSSTRCCATCSSAGSRRSRRDARRRSSRSAGACLDHRLWDEALSVSEHSLDAAFIADAIAVALDDLLAAGRTSSLDRWVNAARKRGSRGRSDRLRRSRTPASPRQLRPIDRARRVCRRHAHWRSRGPRTSRSCKVGAPGEPRDTAGQPPRAREQVRDAATDRGRSPMAPLRGLNRGREPERRPVGRRAVAGRLPNARSRVAGRDRQSPSRRSKRGPLREHIEAAQGRVALVDTASDPYASTSMLNVFAYALFAAGQYRDALAAADKEIAIAEEFELPFVIPYAEINRACSLTALREFAEARRALGVVEKRVRADSDPFFASQHAKQSAALEIARGNLGRAIDHLASSGHPRAPKGTQGTHHALQALVLTALGDFEAAGRSGRSGSRQVERTRNSCTSRRSNRHPRGDRERARRRASKPTRKSWSRASPMCFRSRGELASRSPQILLESRDASRLGALAAV